MTCRLFRQAQRNDFKGPEGKVEGLIGNGKRLPVLFRQGAQPYGREGNHRMADGLPGAAHAFEQADDHIARPVFGQLDFWYKSSASEAGFSAIQGSANVSAKSVKIAIISLMKNPLI